MKKLMVLSLVLAIGAVSSAALEFTFADGSINVASTTPIAAGIDLGFGIIGDAQLGAIEFAGGDKPVGAPEITGLGDVTGMGFPWNDLTMVLWQQPRTDLFAAGDWMSIAISGDWILGSADDFAVQVDILDGSFGVLESIYLAPQVVIPEPMTMGLLGLGALFLRRRK